MVMGLVVALAIAGDRKTGAALRTLAAAAAVPMCFTFFFTFSRGGWIALAVALVLYFAFTTTRLASVMTPGDRGRAGRVRALAAAGPRDAVRRHHERRAAHAAGRRPPALGDRGAARRRRRCSWWSRCCTRRCPGRGGRPISAGAVVLAVVLVVGVGGSGRYVQSHGGVPWVKDRLHALVTDADDSGGGNGAGRLFTLSTNGRVDLWREAARQSRYHRAAGTGAGTFPFAHYRFRDARRRGQARAQPVVQRAERARRGGPGPPRRRHGPVRGRGGRQSLLAPPRPAAPAARRPAGGRDRLHRPHVVGLGLGHGGDRDDRLRLHRGLRLVQDDEGGG